MDDQAKTFEHWWHIHGFGMRNWEPMAIAWKVWRAHKGLNTKVIVDLPERLSRDQAEIICELSCKEPCNRDCDCNPDVQAAWQKLKASLEGEIVEIETNILRCNKIVDDELHCVWADGDFTAIMSSGVRRNASLYEFLIYSGFSDKWSRITSDKAIKLKPGEDENA